MRTAALHASAEELAADISRLRKVWDQIGEESKDGGVPPLSRHQEPELLIRVIREHFTADFRSW